VRENWGCTKIAHFIPKPAFDADGTNVRKILEKKEKKNLTKIIKKQEGVSQ